ncbi:MAG: hypothetical protein A3F67_02615 [Verrucomicrobia bacterium RIFCSPHIGHO2_12_FULL_41_10]|nr:MAG: hypothetical protein A3F67_02615 [Verrucomicrobia bacterium RIFCSPHIGHO2_12_FULL_41_10]HLB34441.1 HepT-like ribonuclease domain-containing protein [Chthoniobacterales bacterium]
MTLRVQKYLVDAQIAVSAICEFLEEKTFEDFTDNLLLRSAVERQLITLGEALNLASQEKENLELDIPNLPQIVGLRNRIVHGYNSIDYELLWIVIQTNVPPLHQRLIELL